MWIKNKVTGLKWDISNKDQIARLLRDPDYVESRKAEPKKAESKKEA